MEPVAEQTHPYGVHWYVGETYGNQFASLAEEDMNFSIHGSALLASLHIFEMMYNKIFNKTYVVNSRLLCSANLVLRLRLCNVVVHALVFRCDYLCHVVFER
jgi:hypothetical protein